MSEELEKEVIADVEVLGPHWDSLSVADLPGTSESREDAYIPASGLLFQDESVPFQDVEDDFIGEPTGPVVPQIPTPVGYGLRGGGYFHSANSAIDLHGFKFHGDNHGRSPFTGDIDPLACESITIAGGLVCGVKPSGPGPRDFDGRIKTEDGIYYVTDGMITAFEPNVKAEPVIEEEDRLSVLICSALGVLQMGLNTMAILSLLLLFLASYKILLVNDGQLDQIITCGLLGLVGTAVTRFHLSLKK